MSAGSLQDGGGFRFITLLQVKGSRKSAQAPGWLFSSWGQPKWLRCLWRRFSYRVSGRWQRELWSLWSSDASWVSLSQVWSEAYQCYGALVLHAVWGLLWLDITQAKLTKHPSHQSRRASRVDIFDGELSCDAQSVHFLGPQDAAWLNTDTITSLPCCSFEEEGPYRTSFNYRESLIDSDTRCLPPSGFIGTAAPWRSLPPPAAQQRINCIFVGTKHSRVNAVIAASAAAAGGGGGGGRPREQWGLHLAGRAYQGDPASGGGSTRVKICISVIDTRQQTEARQQWDASDAKGHHILPVWSTAVMRPTRSPPPPPSMPSPWLWTQHYLGYRQVIYGDLFVAREERQTQARISTIG